MPNVPAKLDELHSQLSPPSYRSSSQRKIATMAELKRAPGTHADMTVFRKLRQLSYRSSHPHRGNSPGDGRPLYISVNPAIAQPH